MKAEYATLLALLVSRSERTQEEIVAGFEECARKHGEDATLSIRTFRRWLAGDVVSQPRPTQCRVARHYWGYDMRELLAPPPRALTCPPRAEDAREPASDSRGNQPDLFAGCGRATDSLWDAAIEAMEYTRRAESSELGPKTLEHLELVVAGMANAFPLTSPVELFGKVRWYRRQVAQLIEGRHTLRELRELYAYAGWLSIILGWLAHDLGDPLAGEAHCLDAWEHGWQAERNDVCAWAMDALATITMYNHRPEAAREAALKGLSQAPGNSAAAIRVSCQLARAHARLGHGDQFRDALHAAQNKLGSVSDLGSGLFSADAGRLASYAAASFIWLAQPEQAVSYARDAISFYESLDLDRQSPTREAISRLDLSLGLLALRMSDVAIEEATRALDSDRITGSILVRASDVDSALRSSYPTSRATVEFHDRYVALVEATSNPLITCQRAGRESAEVEFPYYAR